MLTRESGLKSENRLADLHKALNVSDWKLDYLRTLLDESKKDLGEGFSALLAASEHHRTEIVKQQQLTKIENRLGFKDIFLLTFANQTALTVCLTVSVVGSTNHPGRHSLLQEGDGIMASLYD
jgi:hypothetical protein